MSNMVEVRDIVTRFGTKTVHDGVSIDIKKGEVYGILGGSGSGKSTLMREIIMLQQFQGGDIKVMGKSIKNISHADMSELKKNWAVLFQFGALYSSLNVIENVSIPLVEYTDLPKEMIEQIALSKLKMSGLKSEATYLFPSELSGGQNQRIAIARALANEPDIILADEPTAALDKHRAVSVVKMLKKITRERGVTIIMVTHDDRLLPYCDKILTIENKKIDVKVQDSLD